MLNTKFGFTIKRSRIISRKNNQKNTKSRLFNRISSIHNLNLEQINKVNILKEGIVLEKGLNPKIVHRTWKTKPEGQMLMESNRLSNFLGNEWEVKWYDDNECREMIKDNFQDYVLSAYDSLIPPAYKSDLWRYCCIYLYGGFYLDASLKHGDMHYDIIRNTCDMFLIRDRNKDNIYQANFMCKSGEILLKKCILKICEYHKTKNINGHPKKNRIKCLSVTGPGLVGCVTRELYGLRLILGDEIVINNIRIKLGDHARAGKYMYKNYNISFGKYKNYATYQKRVNRCHYHIDWQRGRVWR